MNDIDIILNCIIVHENQEIKNNLIKRAKKIYNKRKILIDKITEKYENVIINDDISPEWINDVILGTKNLILHLAFLKAEKLVLDHYFMERRYDDIENFINIIKDVDNDSFTEKHYRLITSLIEYNDEIENKYILIESINNYFELE